MMSKGNSGEGNRDSRWPEVPCKGSPWGGTLQISRERRSLAEKAIRAGGPEGRKERGAGGPGGRSRGSPPWPSLSCSALSLRRLRL